MLPCCVDVIVSAGELMGRTKVCNIVVQFIPHVFDLVYLLKFEHHALGILPILPCVHLLPVEFDRQAAKCMPIKAENELMEKQTNYLFPPYLALRSKKSH